MCALSVQWEAALWPLYLYQLGLDLSVGSHFLVGQHISVTFGQGLLAGGGHLDGVGEDRLQDRPQVQAGGRLVVHPLLSASGARATVQRTHWCRCLRIKDMTEELASSELDWQRASSSTGS